MLGKLFKYEWKAVSRMMLAAHGLVVLFAVLSKIFLSVTVGSSVEGTFVLLFMMLNTVIIGSVVMFTTIYFAFRFYKSVFTDQGYLTNTLPVTQNQIIIAKGLTAVLWQVIDFVVVAVSLALIFITKDSIGVIGAGIKEFFEALVSSNAELAAWLTVIALIITPFATILQLYFCIAVGNIFTGHKVLGAIGVFAATYTIREIIDLAAMVGAGFSKAMTGDFMEVSFLRIIDTTMIFTIVVTIVCSVLYYMGTKWILTKKLNLQ